MNGGRDNAATLFEQLYNSYYQRLAVYASARLGEYRQCAEDCVQEAFMLLHRRMQNGEEFENPQAFLYRALDNIVKKQRATRTKEDSRSISIDDENNEIVLHCEDTVDYEKYIKQLQKRLTDDEKRLYNAKYIEEKKIEEIAKQNGMSIAAVTMRLSRLRQKVKKELDDLII